ncbi:MAG: hypothetical protein Q4A74_09735, partial [Cardiobacteriaceae bacterium]|nr:hypothetical protein [Cardiobacteriaceae bacterium]
MSDKLNRYTIVKSQLPLLGGIAGHNFIAVLNPNGQVIHELNGLATSKDNKIKPIGYLPSDKLKVYNETEVHGFFYRPSQKQEVVYKGSYDEVMEKFNEGYEIGQKINDKNFHYPFMGLGENSNSVASTLLKGMGLSDPDLGWPLTPGEGSLLLPEQDLNPFQDLNREGKFFLYDPLALDLDGDGIETISANYYKGALFDHNKSGIRTATGWVSADDGLLVVDRNGDGIINNGNELFGDNTVLKNGNNAENGYSALAEFDSNSDGVVDSKDTDFDKLRIWRDLNHDGVSQKEEIFTLDAVNVKSLNIAHKDVSQSLGNGNTLAQEGSYNTMDGKIQKMGDLLLSHNSLYSRYTDSIALTKEQTQAANLQGIGRLRDLREAAALSKDLAADLKAYSQAETKAEQKILLDSLIDKWARTDPLYGSGVKFLPPALQTANEGVAVTPGQANALKVLQIPQEYLDKV